MEITTRTLEVPGFRTTIRRQGSGPALLLIQGGGAGRNAWAALMDRLSPHLDCIAFDNRGVGEASPVEGALSIHDLARDAAAVIEGLGQGAVHVAGVSLGGFIAMRLAAARPDLVRSLTLHATAARLSPRTLEQNVFRSRLLEAAAADAPALLRAYIRPWAAGAQGPIGDLPADVVTSREEFSERDYLGQMQAIREHDMTSDELRGIQAPTLVVAGAEDILCSVEDARFLHRSIPGSKLVVLERAGHVYYYEEPELAAAIQGGWVAQHAV